MASTITAATMTVTISESITLNGKNQGGTTTKSISSIGEITKRILNISTTEAVIATFSAAVASAGHYVAANVRYMRFTKLDYGQSFIWNGDNGNGMTAVMNATQDADASSFANFGSLTNIQADAETGTVDLEMVIASV